MKKLILIFSLLFVSPIFGQWKKAIGPIKEFGWLCDKDIYKLNKKGAESPIYTQLKKEVQKSNIKTLSVDEKYMWSQGRISTQVFRGGDEIFDQMAKMIERAEHEVLIQTFIFKIKSPAAKKIFKAIANLEAKRKRMKAKKPVVVRFIFDIIGTKKFANFFELMINLKDGGRDIKSDPFSYGRKKGDYRVDFPKKLDPKYVRLEIKAHRHKSLRAVNHAKSIIIDREYGMITGANMVGYHFPSEINTGKGTELMVDHGFVFYGDIGFNMAAEFYGLWLKSGSKENGYADYYSGNVDADKYLPWDEKPLKKPKPYPAVVGIKRFSWGNLTKIGIVGRDSYGQTRRLSQGNSPQNNAFKAAINNAKSHVNINSPNLNSFELMKALRDAMARGVDINFLISKNYQNYNGPLQEGGTNENAVNTLYKWRAELVKKHGAEKIGQFNLVWFVTRGGNVSGQEEGERVDSWRIILNEKFYNHNHTKFLSADNQVVIIGSANFDEQSWYNSRELNIVFDDHQTAKKICRKVFLTDFLRGQGWGSTHWIGEKCWKNSQCRSGLCNNRIGRSWKCVYPNGAGLSGGYCDNKRQCKSNQCDKEINKCN